MSAFRSDFRLVKQLCDEIGRDHPKLARYMLRRKFGDVTGWYDDAVSTDHPCGCLVGTLAIAIVETKYVPLSLDVPDRHEYNDPFDRYGLPQSTASAVITTMSVIDIYDAGVAVSALVDWRVARGIKDRIYYCDEIDAHNNDLRNDANQWVIRLLKNRIRRTLNKYHPVPIGTVSPTIPQEVLDTEYCEDCVPTA